MTSDRGRSYRASYLFLMKRFIVPVRAVFFLLVLLASAPACKHGKCEDGGTSSASRESHNAGANCMNCHHADGEGEVCWTIGGTVYDHAGSQPMSGVRVRLFTQPLGKGTVAFSEVSDRTGNVYTSRDVALSNGLYPAVISANGDTAFMSERILDGACNRCHGSTTGVVELP